MWFSGENLIISSGVVWVVEGWLHLQIHELGCCFFSAYLGVYMWFCDEKVIEGSGCVWIVEGNVYRFMNWAAVIFLFGGCGDK